MRSSERSKTESDSGAIARRPSEAISSVDQGNSLAQQQQFSLPRPTRVVIRLLIALGAIWLLSAIFRNLAESGFVNTLYAYLHLRPTEVIPGAYVWQIGTSRSWRRKRSSS